jgi:hypothetical protein
LKGLPILENILSQKQLNAVINKTSRANQEALLQPDLIENRTPRAFDWLIGYVLNPSVKYLQPWLIVASSAPEYGYTASPYRTVGLSIYWSNPSSSVVDYNPTIIQPRWSITILQP